MTSMAGCDCDPARPNHRPILRTDDWSP